MATIVLSAAGMAIGGSVGGSVLGLSTAVIGRAVGASLGSAIDSRLLGAGSEPVETGRIDRFRLSGASDGASVARIFGRIRVAGQVIWATQFKETETRSGGGKGTSGPATISYSYSVSLAIALCEGAINHVGRIWADGQEIARGDLNMRVYTGSETQQPDPKIEAVEGLGQTPAYRGTAYVVLEDLSLEQFGNRVPQFTFEVSRTSQADADEDQTDVAAMIPGVALVPGTGEYALATQPVYMRDGLGQTRALNVNSASAKADFLTSLDELEGELPNCGSVSLVVSWFGDDLRCGNCEIAPKVEQAESDPQDMPWRVSGMGRGAAGLVPFDDDARPIYGGTPTDASVIQSIEAIKQRGKDVVFYPFILMEQTAGNTLPDPYSGENGQAHLPWRGRITTSIAPGISGSPDRTVAAETEVAAFFGSAQPGDFTVSSDTVTYNGPAELSYRRFILHYAHLCAAAGGVSAFCIGSEMRGLTQIRGAGGAFPAVDALQLLAADVRAIVGPDVKIGYAADWSEYHGYQPVGTADKLFHLDPLWADPNIDFVGIDNYMPLSDWRDGTDHTDQGWESPYNLEYLKSNIEGGEGYDWYYHSPEARDAQIRTPITDGQGEPWIWRVKDFRGWWSNYHHNRIDGVRAALPTAWVPGSKPIWFTEIGCAAIDKGTNQPNKFLDEKSSESSLPYYSNGQRDEVIQNAYLRATIGYYSDPQNNPTNPDTGVQMVDLGRTHVWAWDARPYPYFPGNTELWSDGVNYARGHWLNGRAAHRALASVVAEICKISGIERVETDRLHGLVRGYGVPDVDTARAAIQPLALAYGFDVIERDGALIFLTRGLAEPVGVTPDEAVVVDDDTPPIEDLRAPAAELSGRVRVVFIDVDGDYETRAEEASISDGATVGVSKSEFPLVLSAAEARAMAERWLTEARIGRSTVRLSLPPSRSALGAGDVLRLGNTSYRVDRVETGQFQRLEAQRIEPDLYSAANVAQLPIALRDVVAPTPVDGVFMDLPLLTGEEVPHAPHFASYAKPWPGGVALYSSAQDYDYGLNILAERSAVVGVTENDLAMAQPGVLDRGSAVRVKLASGALESVSYADLTGGANVAAIGDGTPDNWEIIQFMEAELVAPDTYDLRMRLRGQAGSDQVMAGAWPAGSMFVLLNTNVAQISLAASARGVMRHFRFGPATRPVDDPSYRYLAHAFSGNGLRPYSVAHLRLVDEETRAFSWQRRTRIDGDAWDGFEVPLGEEQELYRVRIVSSSDILREEYTSTNSFIYENAAFLTDGSPSSYSFEVSQISAQFGAGASRAIGVSA